MEFNESPKDTKFDEFKKPSRKRSSRKTLTPLQATSPSNEVFSPENLKKFPAYDAFIKLGRRDLADVIEKYEENPHNKDIMVEKLLEAGAPPEFINYYLIYPSGRPKSRMKFIPKFRPFTVEEQKKIIKLVETEDILISKEFQNKTFTLREEIYLPVIRYQAGMASLYYQGLPPPDPKTGVCGTFYYFERNSSYFLRTNKIFITPNKLTAMCNLLKVSPGTLVDLYKNIGYDKNSSIETRISSKNGKTAMILNKLNSNVFPESKYPQFYFSSTWNDPLTLDDFGFQNGKPVSKSTAEKYNLLVLFEIASQFIGTENFAWSTSHKMMNQSLKNIFSRGFTMEQRNFLKVEHNPVYLIIFWIQNLINGAKIEYDQELYASEDIFDLSLCWHASEKGYDAVILTEMIGKSRLVTEVYDVRGRSESFDNVFTYE